MNSLRGTGGSGSASVVVTGRTIGAGCSSAVRHVRKMGISTKFKVR